MTNKKFYFLAGIHRSGNTVLSSILNQHPSIYSTPLGPVCDYMWLVHTNDTQMEIMNTFYYRKKQLMSNMMNLYYSDVEKPIIIDREKNWGHPENLNMLKTYVTDNPKIIFTIRPISEVLASTIAINKDPIKNEMKTKEWKYDKNLSENENICEYIMRFDSEISILLSAVESIKNPKNHGVFHIVRYDDLLNKPQETMNSIYNFLDIESFNHDFNNIIKIEEYNDSFLGFSKDLHHVRKKLSRGSVNVNDYVSDYIKQKYSYIDVFFK